MLYIVEDTFLAGHFNREGEVDEISKRSTLEKLQLTIWSDYQGTVEFVAFCGIQDLQEVFDESGKCDVEGLFGFDSLEECLVDGADQHVGLVRCVG